MTGLDHCTTSAHIIEETLFQNFIKKKLNILLETTKIWSPVHRTVSYRCLLPSYYLEGLPGLWWHTRKQPETL